MTIIQLEYLLAVANCGSFSLAAEHCFVTQPSLSMQVKALEEELGVVLLDRSKKPVIPTEAGEVVLDRARETLRAYNNIRESVAELKGETSGKLRLGVIPGQGLAGVHIVLILQHLKGGDKENTHIQRQTHVVHIPAIQLNSMVPLHILTTVHLRPAGNARAHIKHM